MAFNPLRASLQWDTGQQSTRSGVAGQRRPGEYSRDSLRQSSMMLQNLLEKNDLEALKNVNNINEIGAVHRTENTLIVILFRVTIA